MGLAVSEADYQKLFELDQQKRRLQTQIEQEKCTHERYRQTTASLASNEVTADEIAQVVSHWTGVPVTRMMETERAKLLVMEERLHQRVVGQPKRSKPSPMPFVAAVVVYKIQTAPSARSSSWDQRLSVKPNFARLLPKVMFDDEPRHGSARHERIYGTTIPSVA